MRITFFLLILAICCTTSAAQIGTVEFSNSSKTVESKTEFKSGEFIFAHVKFAQPFSGLLKLDDKPLTIVAEYYLNGKLLDDDMFGFESAKVKGTKSAAFVCPVISDPADDVPSFGKNLFSTRLPAALAKLAPGKHEIEFQLKSYGYKDASESMATGKFSILIESGAKAWFQQNERDSYDALTKRGVHGTVVSSRDIAMGATSANAITLVNNCGSSVWLRKSLGSDKTEYRLSPNQEMRYDPDAGYLEQWNFKTLKWNTVTKVWQPNAAGKAMICSK